MRKMLNPCVTHIRKGSMVCDVYFGVEGPWCVAKPQQENSDVTAYRVQWCKHPSHSSSTAGLTRDLANAGTQREKYWTTSRQHHGWKLKGSGLGLCLCLPVKGGLPESQAFGASLTQTNRPFPLPCLSLDTTSSAFVGILTP